MNRFGTMLQLEKESTHPIMFFQFDEVKMKVKSSCMKIFIQALLMTE